MLPNGVSSSRARNGNLPTCPRSWWRRCHPGCWLIAYLAVAYNHPLIRRYLSEPDRAPRDRFLGRVDNLRSQAELGAIRELSRGIPVSHGRVHLGEETATRARVLGDDRVRVSRPEARDVVEGLIERIN